MFIKSAPFLFLLGVCSAFPSGAFLSSLTKSKLHSHRGKHNQVGIYGGQNATIDEFPYLVGITNDGEFLAAGVVLNNKWVITVAGWVAYYEASDLKVVASSSDGTTGSSYNVKEIVFHPSYDSSYLDYDYALLKVKKKFTWSDTLGNVSLPTQEPTVKTALTVAGWGFTTDSDETEAGLQQGTMKWISTAKCAQFYADYGLTDRMGCVYNKGKTTICDNDFGDPFVKDGVLYALAKDASMSEFCTSAAYPIIVSNIYPVVDWIQTQIAN